jgi:CO/xanthine dehydrogenase Mo-binding subunit
LRQMVTEELGLSPEQVRVEVWNTDAVPFDTGVGGSRVTRIASIATNQAVGNARQELLGWPEESIELQGHEVRHRSTGESQRWSELLSRARRAITGRGHYSDSGHAEVTSFTAQVAEVSVDPETGEVKLLRITSAHDVGRVLNPVGHQGQIYGGLMQGIGYALMEELRVEDGRVTTLSFGDYKIPTAMDIPEIRAVVLESDSGVGPYRIKSIGENPNGPVAAAIANAVEDAVGVCIQDLPITAEKVYRALKQGQMAR